MDIKFLRINVELTLVSSGMLNRSPVHGILDPENDSLGAITRNDGSYV
jgi:hypothetical protein